MASIEVTGKIDVTTSQCMQIGAVQENRSEVALAKWLLNQGYLTIDASGRSFTYTITIPDGSEIVYKTPGAIQ